MAQLDEPQLKALMLKGLAGDDAAHRLFLKETSARLRAFFRNRLRGAEEAEDLVQETIIAIHTKRHTYDATYPVTAWIYAIGRYRLIDYVRKVKRRGITAPVEAAEAIMDGYDAEPGDASRDVMRLLDKLSEKQREIIRLVKLDQLTVKEAAAQTGYSESDIKVSVHRGLKTLSKLLADDHVQ